MKSEVQVQVTIRKFRKSDIPQKVKWINNPENNKYLHYDIPLSVEKTEQWFDRIQDRKDRFDAVIEVDGISVGLIGLLSIDETNCKAEYYISLGESAYRGRGVAKEASWQLLEYGFVQLGLNKIYLFTEEANTDAQRLFESIGFIKEGCLKEDVFSRGNYVDRFIYGFLKKDWEMTYEKNRNTVSRRRE